MQGFESISQICARHEHGRSLGLGLGLGLGAAALAEDLGEQALVLEEGERVCSKHVVSK